MNTLSFAGLTPCVWLFCLSLATVIPGCQSRSTIDSHTPRPYAPAEEVLSLEIALTKVAWDLNIDRVRDLLRQGADPDGISGTKARRYQYAHAERGRTPTYGVRSSPLLACLDPYAPGDNNRPDPDHLDAVSARNRLKTQVAQVLLAAGADPNLQVHDHYGGFPLLAASQDHNTFAIRLLLEAGAEVEMSNELSDQFDAVSSPSNALGWAVAYEDELLIKDLLEAGAYPTNGGHVTNPLERAARNGNPRVLQLLLSKLKRGRGYRYHQSDISSAMTNLLTAWSWSVDDDDPDQDQRNLVAGYKSCIKLLADAGATVELGEGNPFYCVNELNETIVFDWLEAALASHPAGQQATLAFLIESFLYSDIPVQQIKARDINFNAQDSRGRTAMHHAAIEGYGEGMARLVHAGVDPNIRDRDGKTAIDLITKDYIRAEYEAAIAQPDNK